MNLYQLTQQEAFEICTPNHCGDQLLIKERFGNIQVRQHAVGHQIDLLRMSGDLSLPVRITADGLPREPIVTIIAFLKGSTRIHMEGYGDNLYSGDAMIGLIYSPNHQGRMDFDSQHSDSISVRMSLQRFRDTLINDQRPQTAKLFSPIINSDQIPLRLMCPRTPSIDRILQDLTAPQSPFAEALLRDARAHELFFTVVEELIRSHGEDKTMFSIRDQQKLLNAKRLLLERIDNPPTLIELAQEVGLNDFKLKKGFKSLFDNTVYGVLLNARLEKARELLVQQRLSITQVSLDVGYSNHGHFSAAFKKRFGMTPREFSRQFGQ